MARTQPDLGKARRRETEHAAQHQEFLRGRPYDVLRVVQSAMVELWQDKAGLFGIGIVTLLLVTAVFAPWLAPHDPAAQSLGNRLAPPFWADGGSMSYPLGADGLGRDVLSRLIFGSRISLMVGLSVVLLAGTFGILMGLLAGYRGGRFDSVIMRVVDTQVAFPGLLLALVILAAIGPSMTTIIVVLAVNGWMVYARITRGVVLSVKEAPYVEAAEIVGCRPWRVILRHILPNLTSPLLQVSWGLMVAQGRDYLFDGWWIITFPGLAIALTVLGVNLFASWLRVAADPQEREKRFARSSSELSQGTMA